eukprot:1670150-Rhodomonas_salina.2
MVRQSQSSGKEGLPNSERGSREADVESQVGIAHVMSNGLEWPSIVGDEFKGRGYGSGQVLLNAQHRRCADQKPSGTGVDDASSLPDWDTPR